MPTTRKYQVARAAALKVAIVEGHPITVAKDKAHWAAVLAERNFPVKNPRDPIHVAARESIA